MAKEKDKLNLKDLPPEVNDPSISQDDFKLVQADKKIHDQKFQTKPTTFLKDCFRRFCKNKSSVVAAFILGFLLVLSIIVPVACKTSEVHETNGSHPEIYYLEPKLFPAGTGFWDGTKKLTNIPADTSDPNPDNWCAPSDYVKSAVSNLQIGKEEYTKSASTYGKGGYIELAYYQSFPAPYTDGEGNLKNEYVALAGHNEIESFDFNKSLVVSNFDVYDLAKLQTSNEEKKALPDSYVSGKTAIYFTFEKDSVSHELALSEYKPTFNVGVGDPSIDVTAKFNELYDEKAASLGWEDKKVEKPNFEIRLLNENKDGNAKNTCTLIKSIEIKTDAEGAEKEQLEALSFTSGNQCALRTSRDKGKWDCLGDSRYCRMDSYLTKGVLCSFTYDTYEAALGTDYVTIPYSDLYNKYVFKKYIKYNSGISTIGGKVVVDKDQFVCEIIDHENCPFAEPFKFEDQEYNPETGVITKIHAKVYKYKTIYGLKSMPIFLLGTDKTGRDMFIYVFEGLRTSLLLGLATTVICFLFGLLYGSISGYFGGTVDLVMERFTDILSGVPWIVVMTLTIIQLGSNFATFAIALCLTGWIGTAATTRTQFYRFRGREYVLASRTLGASHGRLIAKHILPNAMGTIITSAVLMVPSVIFSEATISYLGLGFKNLASLGVILSDNQVELTNHPYLLIFPSVIIALLMISFNLFGNGLRDAVNPSLKGEGE